jgi:hypothetical protein
MVGDSVHRNALLSVDYSTTKTLAATLSALYPTVPQNEVSTKVIGESTEKACELE